MPVERRPLLHFPYRRPVQVALQAWQSVQAVNAGGPARLRVRQTDPLHQTLLQDVGPEVLAGHHHPDITQAQLAQQSPYISVLLRHLRVPLRHIRAPPRHLRAPLWRLRALINHSQSVFD